MRHAISQVLTFALLTAATAAVLFSIGISLGYAGEKSKSGHLAVCRFLEQQFNRPIPEYVTRYGPIKSSTVHVLGKGAKTITQTLAQEVTITYVIAENEKQTEVPVTNIQAKGLDAWQKLGLEVREIGEVRGILGEPDFIEGDVMMYYGYGCEKWAESILQFDLRELLMSVHEMASAD
jgi:hypothetical protein